MNINYIYDIICSHTGLLREEIDIGDTFEYDYAMTYSCIDNLIMDIEDELDMEIPYNNQPQTVGELINLVEEHCYD